MQALDGQVVPVVGASPSLGRATARRQVKDGANLALMARIAADLDDGAEEVRKVGAEVITVTAAISQESGRHMSLVRRAAPSGPLASLSTAQAIRS